MTYWYNFFFGPPHLRIDTKIPRGWDFIQEIQVEKQKRKIALLTAEIKELREKLEENELKDAIEENNHTIINGIYRGRSNHSYFLRRCRNKILKDK